MFRGAAKKNHESVVRLEDVGFFSAETGKEKRGTSAHAPEKRVKIAACWERLSQT